MTALADLNPYFHRSPDNPAKGYLIINCPICAPDLEHRFVIPTLDNAPVVYSDGVKRWGLRGSPPDWATVSIFPSVDLQERCKWHGFITKGEAA